MLHAGQYDGWQFFKLLQEYWYLHSTRDFIRTSPIMMNLMKIIICAQYYM